MERLSTKKKDAIVRQYLSGLSYDRIVVKSSVSKGTVANVVADLKAGRFPEATDAAGHIEQLRELAVDLKQSGLTPGQSAAGILVLTRLRECGLDPGDIGRWPTILKMVGSQEEAAEFVRLVYSIEEVRQRMGLSLDGLHDKVHELEREAAELEPLSGRLEDCKKQLEELTRRREGLASAVADLEEKHKLLAPRVKDLEKRDQSLSHRISDMEPRAQRAETTFATLNVEMGRLQDAGLSLKALAEFSRRMQVIAGRHAIEPDGLRDRLLRELENLDQGLELDAQVQSRQRELDRQERALDRARQEQESIRMVTGSLKQEKAGLEASIKGTREKVSKEIMRITPLAGDTINRLAEELRHGHNEALEEMRRLRDEALEVGKEVGRYQGILAVDEWLNELLALTRGEDGIAGQRVRAIALSVVRGVAAWLKGQDSEWITFASLSRATEGLIRELEQWKV